MVVVPSMSHLGFLAKCPRDNEHNGKEEHIEETLNQTQWLDIDHLLTSFVFNEQIKTAHSVLFVNGFGYRTMLKYF